MKSILIIVALSMGLAAAQTENCIKYTDYTICTDQDGVRTTIWTQ